MLPMYIRTALFSLFFSVLGVEVSSAQVNPPAQEFQEKPVTRDLLKKLRGGGYVLYMRHGNTDNSRPDAYPKIDLTDCETQRVLNEEGRRVSAMVGQYIRRAKIPINEVIHSPMCRARDSAQLAFGYISGKIRQEVNLMYPANLTSEEKKPIVAKTRELLSTPVPRGTNRVLVAHAPNMADVMGYFVKPEATVVVIQPQGEGRFEYIASIYPSMWPELLKDLR